MKVDGGGVESPVPPTTKDQSQGQPGVTTMNSDSEPDAGGLKSVDTNGMHGAPVLLIYTRLSLSCGLSSLNIGNT